MRMPKMLVPLCLAASTFGGGPIARAQHGLPAPTAEHKVLGAEEGTWDATIKSYPNGPEGEADVTRGVEVNTVITGGLWVFSVFKADFNGLAFEGRGQFGYDPNKKKYVGTWVDSMSPALTVLEGSYDANTRTLTYTGEGISPMDGSKFAERMVTTTRADGSRDFTLFMKMAATGGKEAKVMEVHYTRRK